VRDVATVNVGLRRSTDFAIGDDRPAIALLPRREVGSNVLEVTERLKQVVQNLDEQRFAPEGLELRVVDDQSGYINDALDRVRSNLLMGAGLATLVLLVFLRSFAASLVIALSIPICVLATGLCMVLLGRSVNVVSLAGITFAVGMVVDNSIVALENIDTWRSRVSSVKEAAYRGVKEIWGALLASTATTAAVFIPILLWQGEVGELLRDIAYAIAIAVTISFLVSVLMIPSFAAVLFSLRKSKTTVAAGLARFGDRIRDGMTALARYVAARTGRALTVTVVATLLALGITKLLLPKMEYLPTGNRNLVFGIVLPPPGAGIRELQRMGFENQTIMFQHTGHVIDGVPAIHRSFFVGDPSRLFIGGVAEDPNQVLAMRDFMHSIHARIPGAIGFASQAALFSRGIGEGRAIDVELSGSDLNVLTDTAQTLFAELRQVVPGSQIRPQPLLDPGAAEFHVLPERAQVARVGFLPSDVALIADAYVDGTKLGEFGEEGQPKLDVVLRNAGFDAASFDDQRLLDEPVALPSGALAPFGTLARVDTKLGPTVIQHIERSRSITLQLTPPDGMPFETALDRVKAHVDEQTKAGVIPPSVDLALGGSAGKLSEAQAQFQWILVVAFIILFLLLAGLYEDFLAPVVILATLPLAAAGGVLGLALANAFLAPQPLDLMSALGFLILFGVVVNNAILIVDGAITRLREGEELRDATSQAVRSRIRPIFMSTLTSLAGLLPMVLTEGSGSELYRGVGTITLGGLSVSTVLTLLVTPALFVLVWRVRRVFTRRASGAVGASASG
jgi:HAE1 family hydrophobic/amphiphilic exporter-1